MAKFVFGIDLGTTYSCISYVDETGRATVINNLEGTNTTPSVVNFASPTLVSVGQTAKENAVIDPQNTISLVKTLMGKSDFAINYNGQDKSPEEVSAYILKKLASDASALIDEEVKDVVITCPAYFGSAERTATKNAGTIAGLNVLEIISEPTAAALYYGCTKEKGSKTILVYDLGGGTFDVTVMNISENKIEVICSDGNHDLGGKDWDSALMRYLAEAFNKETNFNGQFDEYAQQDMRLKAERAKLQLTSKEEVPVMLDVAGLRARINLTRQTFDEITEFLLNSSIELTDKAIALAAEKGYKVDQILLVGGSTKMPQVTKRLIEKYGQEPKILEPDEAVAKGAAIHAVNVYINGLKGVDTGTIGGTDTLAPSEPLTVNPNTIASGGGQLRDIVVATTKSFAVRILSNGIPKCCNMIIKNTTMPSGEVIVTKKFGTAEANMPNAEIKVYESDYMDEYYEIDEECFLGTATLELPGNLPADAPIEITFKLNREGILEVTGKDLTNNKEVRATMQSKNIMSDETVKAIISNSKDIVVI